MQFLRESQGKAIQAVAERICSSLHDGKRVLWLVSGGSNVAGEVEIMNTVRKHCSKVLDQLAIIPMDERYGERGHTGSNTQLLREAGFDPGLATWIDILEHNSSFEDTVKFYDELAGIALKNAHIVIGQFGMGDNGHVAGIQPDSPATTPGTEAVVGFRWSDYQRLTLTPKALTGITAGYLLAYGPSKRDALERLQQHAEPLQHLPAVLLYDISEAYVYNDQIGSET